MKTVGVKAAAYCLNFAPELALYYGGTPSQERKAKPIPSSCANCPGARRATNRPSPMRPTRPTWGA
jgi:betaine reductase